MSTVAQGGASRIAWAGRGTMKGSPREWDFRHKVALAWEVGRPVNRGYRVMVRQADFSTGWPAHALSSLSSQSISASSFVDVSFIARAVLLSSEGRARRQPRTVHPFPAPRVTTNMDRLNSEVLSGLLRTAQPTKCNSSRRVQSENNGPAEHVRRFRVLSEGELRAWSSRARSLR